MKYFDTMGPPQKINLDALNCMQLEYYKIGLNIILYIILVADIYFIMLYYYDAMIKCLSQDGREMEFSFYNLMQKFSNIFLSNLILINI